MEVNHEHHAVGHQAAHDGDRARAALLAVAELVLQLVQVDFDLGAPRRPGGGGRAVQRGGGRGVCRATFSPLWISYFFPQNISTVSARMMCGDAHVGLR